MIKCFFNVTVAVGLVAWTRYKKRKPKLPEYSSTVEIMLPFRAIIKVKANSQEEARIKANVMVNDIKRFTYACDTYTGVLVKRKKSWFRRAPTEATT